ncbi:MAG: hypothetical protein A2487_16220 [Candidatus Raymondbacteria bacterium RifOxyC12_full_50_8]|nr:MAG: hypothetical protein A2487_16220 [Candidatus Raymondbacteria bacterium RifOxyC12_full_50_8]
MTRQRGIGPVKEDHFIDMGVVLKGKRIAFFNKARQVRSGIELFQRFEKRGNLHIIAMLVQSNDEYLFICHGSLGEYN